MAYHEPEYEDEEDEETQAVVLPSSPLEEKFANALYIIEHADHFRAELYDAAHAFVVRYFNE